MKTKKGTKLREWQMRQREEDLPCAKCKRIGLMTVDHIVPAAFIQSLGLVHESFDDDWNLQYLCRACNSLKGNKFDFTDDRTFPNIKRYIEIAEEYYKV